MPAPAPDPARCPLCGQPNACAMAARGGATGDCAAGGGSCADCWCMRVVIAPAVLAAVPEAARGVACVCAACALGDGAHRDDSGSGRASPLP